MAKRGWVFVVVVTCAAACGDNNSSRRLQITDPPAGERLCASDDKSSALAGLQFDVKVSANGFADGDIVNLSVDGAAPDPQVGKPVASSAVTFSDFTIPEGAHSIEARSADGEIRSVAVQVTVDTAAPAIAFTAPLDGATIDQGDDVDPNTAGLQFDVVVDAAVEDGEEVTLSLTSPAGTVDAPPQAASGGTVTFRVTFDANTTYILRAEAADACDNSGSAEINIGVGEFLAIAITQPLDDAVLGIDDGTVVGDSLQIQVCGTVGSPATATVNVQVDRQTSGQVAATVNLDGTWCADIVTVPQGTHTIDAVGSTAGASGLASITVTVDVDAPDPPTGLTTTITRRNAVQVGWTAPDDGSGGAVVSCQIRVSAIPIADEAAWNALPDGIVIPGVAPGTPQTALITPLKTGRPFFFGLRCFDAANGSPVVQNASAVTLALTSSAAVAPTVFDDWSVAAANLGTAVTGADLNDDGFNDLVVGAPGACRPTPCASFQGLVYIYMGSAAGVSTAPSFVIRGTDASTNEFLGFSLTTLDWNRDGVDDIAIGAPFAAGFEGRAFLFLGQAGSKWTPGASLTPLDDTGADVTFSPDQVPPSPLTGAVFFGFQVASLDFDGDGGDDLAIGVPATPPTGPGTGAGSGTVIVVHSPPASTPILAAIRIPQDLGTGAGKAGTTAVAVQFAGGIEYGTVLGGLGRVNADTFDDLGVGPGNQGSGTIRPSAKVIYGRAQTATPFVTLDETTEVRETILAPQVQAFSTYPQQIGSISDINGDGRRDVMGGDEFGQAVWVVPGGIGPADPPITRTLPQDTILQFHGPGVTNGTGAGLANDAAGLGSDVDGDGVEDLVTAANISNAVYIWYGGETPFDALGDDAVSAPVTFTGATGVFWIGDSNGDALADLVFADSQVTTGGPGALVILR